MPGPGGGINSGGFGGGIYDGVVIEPLNFDFLLKFFVNTKNILSDLFSSFQLPIDVMIKNSFPEGSYFDQLFTELLNNFDSTSFGNFLSSHSLFDFFFGSLVVALILFGVIKKLIL